MGELSGRRVDAALDRMERRMAFETVRTLVDRIPDESLALIAHHRNGDALAAHGITRPLLESLVGDAEDEDERQRRLKDAFDLPHVRKMHVHDLMQEVSHHDDG